MVDSLNSYSVAKKFYSFSCYAFYYGLFMVSKKLIKGITGKI